MPVLLYAIFKKPYLRENTSFSYAPPIIDYEHIENISNKIKSTKNELREKYKIPDNHKVITIMAPNFEQSFKRLSGYILL